MLKKIALLIGVLLVALLGFAASRPDSFRVERATTIRATPDKVFAQLTDFHRWADWSPWEKLDPAMKRTHSGAASGKGAVYAWEGNDQVGSGRMEILEATPSSRLRIQLEFFKPFAARNTAEFLIEPQGEGVRLTWSMAGPSPFLSKLMQVFFSMDKMVGKDFEGGLARLKTIAESRSD